MYNTIINLSIRYTFSIYKYYVALIFQSDQKLRLKVKYPNSILNPNRFTKNYKLKLQKYNNNNNTEFNFYILTAGIQVYKLSLTCIV